jgi:hypothetical protein
MRFVAMSCEKWLPKSSPDACHARDTLVCFAYSKSDFASVSETQAKLKNGLGWLDRDLDVWDIEITRHTLIESRAPNL